MKSMGIVLYDPDSTEMLCTTPRTGCSTCGSETTELDMLVRLVVVLCDTTGEICESIYPNIHISKNQNIHISIYNKFARLMFPDAQTK